MTKAAKRAKIKQARATQQINREANKIIAALEKSLAQSEQEKATLQAELKELKKELVETKKKAAKEKASHKETKAKLTQVTSAFHKIKIEAAKAQELAKKAAKEAATSGAFDSFGKQTGYRAGAQAAGNRIEHDHPGFFALVQNVGIRVLDDIWNYYAKYHSSTPGTNFYDEVGEDYVDEEQYDILCEVMKEKYDIEILI